MRISGIDVSERKPEVVVIPLGNDEVPVWCYPVLSYEHFEALCPKPAPDIKRKLLPGGKQEVVPDTGYSDRLDDWLHKRFAWLIITSLRDVEWAKVKLDDPNTWNEYNEELTQAFSQIEVQRIIDTVMKVCGLSTDAIDKATDSFLASMAVLQEKE
jgi:hypothetical protein